MCSGCWEDMGSPVSHGARVRKTAALIDRLYETHAAGGPLHIVTDDWNLEAGFVRWCLVNALGRTSEWRSGRPPRNQPQMSGRYVHGWSPRNVDWLAVRISLRLLFMRYRTRGAVMAICDKFVPAHG